MYVQVWRYADEEEPFETYTAQDAGLIGESTVKIHVDEYTIVTINGFYKFTTELNDEEVQYLREQQAKLDQQIQMREFGSKLTI